MNTICIIENLTAVVNCKTGEYLFSLFVTYFFPFSILSLFQVSSQSELMFGLHILELNVIKNMPYVHFLRLFICQNVFSLVQFMLYLETL